MQIRLFKAFVASVAALLAVTISAAASASTVGAPHGNTMRNVAVAAIHGKDTIAPNGVGTGGGLGSGVTSVSTYQCPETFCNMGVDFAGNSITSICEVDDDSGAWYLTLDYADDISGFVPVIWMHPNGNPPFCVDENIRGVTLTASTTVYQCPTTACNHGVLAANDVITPFCNLQSGSGNWTLVLDRRNNIEGFRPGFLSNISC